MHVAVLPGAEPEQGNAKIVFTGAFDDGIHIPPVKLSLLRFHLLPIDGSFDGVRVQLGERFPDGRQLRWPAAGVMHLTAENLTTFRKQHRDGFTFVVINIARTLSCLSWARDVVVVDSHSTDATIDLAKGYPNVRLFSRAFDSHADQWNYAISQFGTPLAACRGWDEWL